MSMCVERSLISQPAWPIEGEKQTVRKIPKESSGDAQNPQSTSDMEIALEDLERAADHIGRALEVIDRGLEFSIHEDTNRVIVKVINRQTHEVIKEIPPEQLLDMIARIWEMIGLLVDEKA